MKLFRKLIIWTSIMGLMVTMNNYEFQRPTLTSVAKGTSEAIMAMADVAIDIVGDTIDFFSQFSNDNEETVFVSK